MSNEAQPTDALALDTPESWGFTQQTALETRSPQEVAAAARELGTIAAMVQAAQTRPRNEYRCVQRIAAACARPELADDAIYDFQRGGEQVTGPSATFARFLAAQWGNLRFAIEVVDDKPESRQIRGWAHDLETNTRAEYDHTFSKKIQRKDRKTGVTSWRLTEDERELREMTARWGALLVRNALLSLIPPDVVDKALRACALTRKQAAEKTLKENRSDATHRILFALAKHGVDQAMVEALLGHGVESLNAEELAKLRGINTALEQGQISREDVFEVSAGKGSAAGQAIVDQLRATEAKVVQTPADVAKVDPEWITLEMSQAIQEAVAQGKCSDAHLHEYRKRCQLGKGAKMKYAQAREFLDMIKDGRVHTLVDDGIR